MENILTVNGITLTKEQVDLVGGVIATNMLGMSPKLTPKDRLVLNEIFVLFKSETGA